MKSDDLTYCLRDAQCLERVSSPYQELEIYHHPDFGHMLVIDDDLQISEADHAYGQAMVEPLERLHNVRQVAILGGGDGGVVHELLQSAERFDWPLENITLIDIDPEVTRLCLHYLTKLHRGSLIDQRIDWHHSDALSALNGEACYDVVLYDLTMDPVSPHHKRARFLSRMLDRVETALKPGGMLVMQCCGEGILPPHIGQENERLLEEIRQAVDQRFVYRTEQQVVIPSYQERWRFLSAVKR